MKITHIIAFLIFAIGINAQKLEVEGKMTVKDINTIATFQSTVKNSFINLATNDDPSRSTNIGYFDDDALFGKTYFFIDLPTGNFGEFMIEKDGGVYIGDAGVDMLGFSFSTLNVFANHVNGAIHGSCPNGSGVHGFSDTKSGVRGLSNSGIGVDGDAQNAGSFDFFAHPNDGSTAYGESSSKRWKTNIRNIPDALEKIDKLRGVYFNWIKEYGGMHAVGFIAEEVGEILPEIVVYEENGIDAIGLDYSKMTPILVEAANAMRREYQNKFDEQQSEIDILRKEMAELKSLLKAPIVHSVIED